jgi:hypothetical protein
LSGRRRFALAASVAATILVLATAFLTANSGLYILAGLAAVSTWIAWRGKRGGAPQ